MSETNQFNHFSGLPAYGAFNDKSRSCVAQGAQRTIVLHRPLGDTLKQGFAVPRGSRSAEGIDQNKIRDPEIGAIPVEDTDSQCKPFDRLAQGRTVESEPHNARSLSASETVGLPEQDFFISA